MKIFALNSMQTAFKGRLWLQHDLEYKNNEALKKFGEYIGTETLQGLDIYVRNMPPRDAKTIEITDADGQIDNVRENVKITYKPADKTTKSTISGFYLNENEDTEAQLGHLKENLKQCSRNDIINR